MLLLLCHSHLPKHRQQLTASAKRTTTDSHFSSHKNAPGVKLVLYETHSRLRFSPSKCPFSCVIGLSSSKSSLCAQLSLRSTNEPFRRNGGCLYSLLATLKVKIFLFKRRETPVLHMRAFSCPCIVSCAIGYKSSVRARVYIRRCRRRSGAGN